MINIFKSIIIFSFLFFSAAIAQNCTYDWECGNVPYAICSSPGCSNTLPGIAIDAYPLIYYATICPSNGGSEITFKSIDLDSGVITDKYSISIPETSSTLTVLDGLFNSIYFKTSVDGPLRRVIAGEVYSVPNVRRFAGHINLERDPEGVTTACGSTLSDNDGSGSNEKRDNSGSNNSDNSNSNNSDSNNDSSSSPSDSSYDESSAEPEGDYDTIDLYGGLQENYMGFANSIFYLPAGSCGASRIRPKVDGSTSTDLFFTTIVSGVTNFYRGPATCVYCPLPSLLFSVNEIINDFDLSPQYIFFGTSSGLYRTDLDGQNKVQLTQDNVSGVRIRDDKQYNDGDYNKIYFNTGSSIRSINADGSNNVRLDQQISAEPTCQCRGRFSGENCNECDGQVQWNDGTPGIPSCVATVNGVPESCSYDYQCGNLPFTVCGIYDKCECSHWSLSGAKCDECGERELSWENGQPLCL